MDSYTSINPLGAIPTSESNVEFFATSLVAILQSSRVQTSSQYEMDALPTLTLPPMARPTSLGCADANARLTADLARCVRPLNTEQIQSPSIADNIANTVVSCICSSKWDPTSSEMSLSLQSSCDAPSGVTKENQRKISDACGRNPFNASAIVNSLSLSVKLANGKVYKPYSARSSEEKLLHRCGSWVTIGTTIIWAWFL